MTVQKFFEAHKDILKEADLYRVFSGDGRSADIVTFKSHLGVTVSMDITPNKMAIVSESNIEQVVLRPMLNLILRQEFENKNTGCQWSMLHRIAGDEI